MSFWLSTIPCSDASIIIFLKCIRITSPNTQYNMAKNHQADISNANKGTKGTNITYDKNQGNRGKQLQSNQQNKKK